MKNSRNGKKPGVVTLTEVAKRAEVSPSTVSKALRGSNDINKDTATRISALAVEMGYTLEEKKNHYKKQCVGIVCPEIISSYYARIVSKLTDLFREKDIETFLGISDFNGKREAALLEQMISMKMTAIICITEQNTLSPLIRKNIALHGIPILQIAMNMQSIGHDNICIDERIGLTLIVSHLTQLGHSKIAFLGEQYSERRLQYFQEAMRDHGLDENYVFITQTRHWQAGYELVEKLLGRKKRQEITAVVAEYDDIAVGAVRRFGEAGLQVPGDYSIVGFDDAKYCRYLPVALTTVESHVEEMCGISFDIIFKKIKDSSYKVFQHISIAPDLVLRESTGEPRENKM
jgi:DNA-binding LacI/PurR family transcriptional regulator